MLLDNKFIKGISRDEEYSYGPKISLKILNKNQTINLRITEFLSPTLFFAFEDIIDFDLDYKLNLFYDSLNEFFYFDYLPKVGTICVVKSHSDKRWYRAKVLSSNFQFKTIDLYLLDYGYIEKNSSIKYIRKLESTFSTQFSTYLNYSLNNESQAALFGLTGIKPPRSLNCRDEESILKMLCNHENYCFQVIDLPENYSKEKVRINNTIPLFLLRNETFCKETTTLSSLIIKKLSWEECSFNESLDVIIQTLSKIRHDSFSAHIIIPNQLRIYQRLKSQEKQVGSIESPLQSQTKYESNLDQSTENNEELESLSDKSAKDLSEEEECNQITKNILELSLLADDNGQECGPDQLNSLKNEISMNKNQSETEDIDDEDITSYCSIIRWKMTSNLVESQTKGLQWHLPLPEERVFRALVTAVDNKLGFHINVCSTDIVKSFKILEKSLLKHFLLCNNSMLRQFVSEIELKLGTICLCMNNSTYNRAVIVGEKQLDGKYPCKVLDYGYNITIDKCDIIPISDQFCNLPPLAVECTLSGFGLMFENITVLVDRFKEILEECDYEVLVTLCFMDKRGSYVRIDDKIIMNQPMAVELFVSRTGQNGETKIESINVILHELHQEYVKLNELEGVEPTSVSPRELYLCSEPIVEEDESEDYVDAIEELEDRDVQVEEEKKGDLVNVEREDNQEEIDGMNDIYLTQQIIDENELPHIYDKKPVCEYYRKNRRCFKGSKCQDRHVLHSDSSDNEENDDMFDWVKSASYLTSSFERQLRKGSTIGLRVTAIYNNGIFYASLTHGINGFDTDNSDIYESNNNYEVNNVSDIDCENDDNSSNTCTNDDIGLDFMTVQDMEDSLSDCMKYKYSTLKDDVELPINTLVAVMFEERIRRASVTNLVSFNRYQVFLVDYGISIEVHLESLFLLPKEYYMRFKQQCFMCKLGGVSVSESDSQVFADWFYDRVNKRVLHAKVLETHEDGMNFVELYDFISDSCSPSINSIAIKDLKL